MSQSTATFAPIAAEPQAALPAAAPPLPHLRLQPQQGWVRLNLKELWQARELLLILSLRDIRVRYKQTALGVAWVVLSPLITATIFTVIFSGLAKLPSEGVPYPLFAFSGILLFNLFSHCTTAAVGSLVNNRHLISKIYFPRLIYPMAPILGGLLDFSIGAATITVLALYYQVHITWLVVFCPIFVVMAVLLGLGLGLWLGALNVQYRDMEKIVVFLMQVWMYSSPVVFPLSLARTQWPHAYFLLTFNPMAGIIEGFRWTALGAARPPLLPLILAPIVTAMVLVGGLYFFRRMEKLFADLV